MLRKGEEGNVNKLSFQLRSKRKGEEIEIWEDNHKKIEENGTKKEMKTEDFGCKIMQAYGGVQWKMCRRRQIKWELG